MLHMDDKKAELNHAGYEILDAMDNPLFYTSPMQEAASMLMDYPGIKLEELYEFLLSTFPYRETLRL